MKTNQKKNICILSLGILCLVGTYNAMMIGSNSQFTSNNSQKRLDETLGEVKVGRSLAVAQSWNKIEKKEVVAAKEVKTVAVVETNSSSSNEIKAAIENNLDLKLVEVSNTKLWNTGVQASEFGGSVVTNNGVIENLSANLPNGFNLEVSFSEMTGNTFEYDFNGEVYAALMYQVDQNAFIVSLTNGPLEGTKLRFAGEVKDSSNHLAENHNISVGHFGEEVEMHVEASQNYEMAQASDASFVF